METLQDLLVAVRLWLMEMREPAAWGQIGVLVVAAGVAGLVNARLARTASDPAGESLFRHLARRTAKRIVFPISMLVSVLAGRILLDAAHWPAGALKVAVPLLLSLAGIRLAVYALRKTFAPSATLQSWEHVIGSGAWTLVALHLLGWLDGVLAAMDAIGLQLGHARVSLLSVSKMILLVGLLLSVAVWASSVIERKLRSATHLSAGLQVGLAKLIKFALMAIAVLAGLNAVGIDLTALTVFGGALGVGLGFGLQRIASNFISGFILIMDRSIRPGDVITLGDSFGWVQQLRARYVVVRNRDGVDTLIPNESIITSEVINWSYSDRRVRLRIPVEISYDDDPEKAMALLLEATRGVPRILDEPAPTARFLKFGENGLGLELRLWIRDPENGVGAVRSTVNLAIWKLFKQAGISFPNPQRDVYVKELPAPGSLMRAQSGNEAA